MDAHIAELRDVLPGDVCLRERVPLAQYTTLQAGGEARWLTEVRDLDALSEVVSCVQRRGVPHIILGSGSNVLPSDNGFPGLVIVNACTRISLEGAQTAETGCWFQDLFLNAAQRGLAGLEFAVGIPGTLGGAMVSNAGAYRANIADQLAEIEIVENAERKWVKPDYLQFGYRDSILRRSDPPPIALLSVRLRLR
ncbi:MAG: FAD-binding protein, partial [Armatimonadetes bacterium]|nr:FAD-binding protein [Armatimonadota bacterium]